MGRLTTRGDSRGYPPWVHFFWVGPQVLARVGDWLKEPMNKVDQSRETSFHAWCCHHGLPRVSRPQEQTVWPCVAVRSASQDYVLGGVFLYHGQAQEGGARVERVAQMRADRVSSTPGRRSAVEPNGGTIAYPQEKWLPPLPSYDGSPVVGE